MTFLLLALIQSQQHDGNDPKQMSQRTETLQQVNPRTVGGLRLRLAFRPLHYSLNHMLLDLHWQW